MQSVDSWAAIWPPLTLAILASIAKKYGEVQFLDSNVEDLKIDEILTKIKEFDPHIVVINATFPSIDSDDYFAQLVKRDAPHRIILGFGVFFTLLEEQALSDTSGYDVAIIGEPEETFNELLRKFQSHGKIIPIEGLIWREDGAICKGPTRPFIKDLDTIPVASRELLKNDRYQLPLNGHPFTLINIARGCPYSCSFCIANVYYGKRQRHHSVDYVIREIQTCIQNYGIKDFLFWEEIFTLNKEFGTALCKEIIARDLKISWATTTRADQVSFEILKIMKAAGCTLLGMGIESASQRILDGANKQENIAQIRRALALCKKAEVPVMGHFIFGLPGETEESAGETLRFLLSEDLDYMQCYCAVPYPKTPLGETAKKNGWITAKHWSEYNFGGHSIMNTGAISPIDVDKYRKLAFRKFYFRPSFIFRIFWKFSSFTQLLKTTRFRRWIKHR